MSFQQASRQWNEDDVRFMRLAIEEAKKAECLRRQVGAVLVRDGEVLATGYNGAPRGAALARDVGCLRMKMGIPSGRQLDICRGIHAEQRVIARAAARGIAIGGSTLYCTHHPCSICAHIIIEAELERVVFCYPYPDPLGAEALAEVGITTVCIPDLCLSENVLE